MANISPLLQNHIYNSSPETKVYESLKEKAHEAKPNPSTAYLVTNNPFIRAKDVVADTFKDAKNFNTAVKTGNMSDNNLGRMNDLGMKIGSMVIASFLALHSKTKTDAIMRFVGGASFIAAMSVWPKLFIFLPSKIIHGVDPGRKYVSSQGDKKDFYLDNKYLVWDATDIKDEREQRRHQKTACQSRTLWMATAGFMTPLLTALFCNRVEPLVRDGVIKAGAKKTKSIFIPNENSSVDSMERYLDRQSRNIYVEKLSKSNFLSNIAKKLKLDQAFNEMGLNKKANFERNVAMVDEVCKGKGGVQTYLDKTFFAKLAQLISLDAADVAINEEGNVEFNIKEFFKNPDDVKFARNMKNDMAVKLKLVYEDMASVDMESLKEALSSINGAGKTLSSKFLAKGTEGIGVKTINTNLDVDTLIKEFEQLPEQSITALKDFLKSKGLEKYSDRILEMTKYDGTKFVAFIKNFNADIMPTLRGRFYAFKKSANNIVSASQESCVTNPYLKTREKFLSSLNFSSGELKRIARGMRKKGEKVESVEVGITKNILVQKFSKIAQDTKDMSNQEYLDYMKKFTPATISKEVQELIDAVRNPENIDKIKLKSDDKQVRRVIDGLFGRKDSALSAYANINSYVKEQLWSFDALRAKPLMIMNFERSVATGEFERTLADKGLISSAMSVQNWIDAARDILYDSSVAKIACDGNLLNGKLYDTLKGLVFNPENFKEEEKILPDIKQIAQEFSNISISKIRTEEYLKATSFSDSIKRGAGMLRNNTIWLKRFGFMAIFIAAATLLIQPFFGNVKDEFPENDKKVRGRENG